MRRGLTDTVDDSSGNGDYQIGIVCSHCLREYHFTIPPKIETFPNLLDTICEHCFQRNTSEIQKNARGDITAAATEIEFNSVVRLKIILLEVLPAGSQHPVKIEAVWRGGSPETPPVIAITTAVQGTFTDTREQLLEMVEQCLKTLKDKILSTTLKEFFDATTLKAIAQNYGRQLQLGDDYPGVRRFSKKRRAD